MPDNAPTDIFHSLLADISSLIGKTRDAAAQAESNAAATLHNLVAALAPIEKQLASVVASETVPAVEQVATLAWLKIQPALVAALQAAAAEVNAEIVKAGTSEVAALGVKVAEVAAS